MFCSYCGKEIEDGALFCVYCGARTNQQVSDQQKSDDQRAKQIKRDNVPPANNIDAQFARKSQNLESIQKDAVLADRPKKTHVGFAIGISCAVFAICLLIGGLIIIKSMGGKNKTDDASNTQNNSSSKQAGELDLSQNTETTELTEVNTEAPTTAAVTATTNDAEDEDKEEKTEEKKVVELDDAALKKIKETYIRKLGVDHSDIENVTWLTDNEGEERVIAYRDINSDGVPELVYLKANSTDNASLYIYTYRDEEIKLVKEWEYFSNVAQAGTGLYIAEFKDGNDLLVYHRTGEDYYKENYYLVDIDENGSFDIKQTLEYIDGDDGTSYKDGSKLIDEARYSEIVEYLKKNTGKVLMADKEGLQKIDESNLVSMTITQAKEELGAGLDFDVESLFVTTLPITSEIEFIFASGAGAWDNILRVDANGNFSGKYHDSEMGENDDEYPGGTIYYSDYTGKFKNIKKIDDYTYSMELDYYTTKQEIGTEEVWEEALYKYVEPYGIDGGETFYFYLPGKPVYQLSDEFISWSSGTIGNISEDSEMSTYGICNDKEGYGFYSSKPE